jgi:hypothetical protein
MVTLAYPAALVVSPKHALNLLLKPQQKLLHLETLDQDSLVLQ